MKNLDLNNYGVQEMNAEEMQSTDGGIFALLALIGGFVVGLIINHFTEE
jgi:lactobin A/cerein 7B family class IIb bacteriocin